MKTHPFYKDEYGGWYMDLEQGGSNGDLAMVAGADTMLDLVSEGGNSVTITVDTAPFEGADELKWIRLREPSTGGGDYVMHAFEGKVVNQEMWLCGVTEFVFGGMPERIYVKKENSGSF